MSPVNTKMLTNHLKPSPLMLPLTGLPLVRFPPLRTKVHVVHVGLSQLLPPSNLLKESRVPVPLHSPSNNLLIVQDHSETKDVMVVGWTTLSNISKSTVSLILTHILTPPEMVPVESKVDHTRSPDTPQLDPQVTVTKLLVPSVVDPSPLPLMPLTGHSMPVVSSETVLPTLTMVSSSSVLITPETGTSRTLGVDHGVTLVTSPLPPETLVVSVTPLHMLTD